MFHWDDREWLARATPVDNPRVDVCFALLDHFFTGDPNDADQFEDPRFRVPLPAPAIGAGDSYVLSTTMVIGREEALGRHYREVAEQAAAIGLPFDHYCHHFWLRLSIAWEEEALSFPWFDTWSDMDRLLGWLPVAEEDQDWWEADEGWEMAVVRRGDRFFARQGNGEGEEHLNVSMNRAGLLASAEGARTRTVAVIGKLSAYLGADVWTQPTDGQEVVFGTGDWDPNGRRPPRGWFRR